MSSTDPIVLSLLRQIRELDRWIDCFSSCHRPLGLVLVVALMVAFTGPATPGFVRVVSNGVLLYLALVCAHYGLVVVRRHACIRYKERRRALCGASSCRSMSE